MTPTGAQKRRPTRRRAGGPPEVQSPLGERLRAERDRAGLSLRELARRLEVSPSLVSQVENGKIQPSVRTLYAMVSVLGVSLDELFAATGPGGAHESTQASDPPRSVAEEGPRAENGRVQRKDSRRAIELESGVRWERLTAWNDPDVEFLYAIYEVGGASASDGKLVRHNGREFGLVISGQLGVTVGFEEHLLGEGDSISFASDIPHCLHNQGDEAAHAIWVVLGRHHEPVMTP